MFDFARLFSPDHAPRMLESNNLARIRRGYRPPDASLAELRLASIDFEPQE